MTLFQRLLASDAARRVIRTFLVAFLGLAIPGFLGWLNDLTTWSRSDGQSPFPDAHSLAYLAVSAIVAGAIAAMNLIVVLLENWLGKGFLRQVDQEPNPRPQGGYAHTDYVIGLALAGALGALLMVAIVALRT